MKKKYSKKTNGVTYTNTPRLHFAFLLLFQNHADRVCSYMHGKLPYIPFPKQIILLNRF